MIKTILTLLFVFIILPSKAQSLIILKDEDSGQLGKYFTFLEDKTNTININDLIKGNKKLNLNHSDVFVPHTSSKVLWVKFQIKNITDNNYFLVINNPRIDTLEVYSVHKKKIFEHFTTGISKPFSARPIKRGNFLIPLNLPKGEIITFYIRYYSPTIKELPTTIETAKNIIEKSFLSDIGFGIFYGILIVVMVFSFCLYLILEDISYLIFIGYILFIGLYRATFLGHIFQFLPSYSPKFFQIMAYFALSIAECLLIYFSLLFLKVKEITHRLYYPSFVLYFLFITFFIISFFNKELGYQIITLAFLLTTLYLTIVGWIIYKKGYALARYYLLAFGSYFICVLVAISEVRGLLPYNTLTSNILHIGICIQAILLSLALGDHYNLLKKEKEEAQAKSQEDLKKINESLVATNTDLDNFIYTASHDLKVPIINIEGLISMINSNPGEIEEVKNITDMMSVSVKKFKNSVNDLTEISKLQSIQEKDISVNDIKAVVQETQLSLKDKINDAKALIKTNFRDASTIKFSKINFQKTLYHLIDNAIKFRSPDRSLEIFIQTLEKDEYIILSISDNGLGINERNLNKIFLMFKKAHDISEGRGVGLYVVKRIIENAGGKIEVESEVNKGSTFNVYFKKE